MGFFLLLESWLGQIEFAPRILVLNSCKRILNHKIPLNFLFWAFVDCFVQIKKMQLECTEPLNLSDCPFFPRIILEFQMGWLLNGSFPLGKAVLPDKEYYEKRRGRFCTLFFFCVCVYSESCRREGGI